MGIKSSIRLGDELLVKSSFVHARLLNNPTHNDKYAL